MITPTKNKVINNGRIIHEGNSGIEAVGVREVFGEADEVCVGVTDEVREGIGIESDAAIWVVRFSIS